MRAFNHDLRVPAYQRMSLVELPSCLDRALVLITLGPEIAMARSIADELAMGHSTLYSLLARASDRQRWRVQHALSATP